MNMKKMKRYFALLLCLCMAVTLLAPAASAAEGEEPVQILGTQPQEEQTAPQEEEALSEQEIPAEGETIKIGADAFSTDLRAPGETVQPMATAMTWSDLQSALSAGGTVTLTNDVTAGRSDTYLTVPEGIAVTLDLNGYTIDRHLGGSVTYGNVIDVRGDLTLTDSSATNEEKTNGTGKITGGWNLGKGVANNLPESNNGGGVSVYGGKFTLAGGSITGNKAGYSGGGVYVHQNSTFIMSGGSISDNVSAFDGAGLYVAGESSATITSGYISNNSFSCGSLCGGGVCVMSSSLTMEGGEISGNNVIDDRNKAFQGGGVYVVNGTFVMSGGTIAFHEASSEGGGVYIDKNSSFTMSGGTVANNNSLNGGGVDSEGEFTFSGGVIEGNSATGSCGGGVYNGGNFTMTGGSIKSNQAQDSYHTSNGGGVFNKGAFIMNDGSITGNNTNGSGGGVYVDNNGSFTMTGGSITGNTGYSGGGVSVRTFELSGSPVISGNVKDGTITDGALTGGTPENIYLVAGKTISITDPLTEDASIGVTMKTAPTAESPVTITSGLGTEGNLSAFFSDSSNYVVGWNTEHTEAVLAVRSYNVTIADSEHGVVSAKNEAAAGETVALTVTPDKGYELESLSVTDDAGNSVSVENNQFTMPASNVTVTAAFNEAVKYTVHFSEAISHGTVSADKSEAIKDDIVTLTVTPDKGYELASLSVTDDTGSSVSVENNRFTMPASNVTVTAAFEAIKYNVTIPGNLSHGSVTSDKTEAIMGDTVTLTVAPNEGYELASLRVVDAQNAPVTVENNQFTMPASNVTVTAVFHLTWSGLQTALSAGGTVKLPNNVTASESDAALEIPEDVTVTLDLAGYTINRNLSAPQADGEVLNVVGSLTLIDSVGTGKIIGGCNTGDGGGIFLDYGASLNLQGGKITDNQAAQGGGVFVDVYASLSVSGSPVIVENQGGNLYLDHYKTRQAVINVNGALTDAASICVRVGTPIEDNSVTFTSGLSNWGDLSAFFTEDEYLVDWNTAGTEAVLRRDIMTWVQLQERLNAGGEIVLKSNVVAEETDTYLTVPSGVTVTLDLNGYAVDRNLTEAKASGVVIIVRGDLTLTDSSATDEEKTNGTGKITGGNNTYSGGGVYVYDGSFTMEGGSIEGNTANDYGGGGVYVESSGSFTMSGGSIEGNTAQYYGGGVYVENGSFNMSGGSIEGNTASDGGGVYVKNGSFSMDGGSISGNTARSYGGGVYVKNGSFSMNGGSISGNTASPYGGGVYVYDGSFTMSGGSITGNTANSAGGGVYVGYSGSFTMEGGSIEGNTTINVVSSSCGGGGVYVSSSGSFTMTGGSIMGNTARYYGGGVCVDSNAVFELSGSPVISGNLKGGSITDGVLSGGTAENVCLANGAKIVPVGALKSTARIGVTTATPPSVGAPILLTDGLTARGRIGVFFSDNEDCICPHSVQLPV